MSHVPKGADSMFGLRVQTLSQVHQPRASLRLGGLESHGPDQRQAFAEYDAERTWASLPPGGIGTWQNLFIFPPKFKCIGQEPVDVCRPQGRSRRLDVHACRR
jgi:hypothetical protein